MAYTIISQNNTTTTLSDENGNVITVPARVTLATSTDYTIIKVNNNSVDLESGDGKIIRGVPACVVLAGGGGGDQHNLGYYATLAELQAAYPTGEAGDWAIVAESDTVYIWDDTQQAWVDTDQKGQVTSVNNQTGDVVLDLLPDQTGQSGKFLTTDGTDASWSDKPLVNKATNTNSLTIGGSANSRSDCVNIGVASIASNGGVVIGYGAGNSSSTYGVAIGTGAITATSNGYEVAIGTYAAARANRAIQIGRGDNYDANTFKVGNANGNFEIMSADGTIPAARHASLPATDGTYVLKLVITSGVPTLEWVAE